jgi:60 kDa SS-A/Ro ribonucleoprotein
VAKLNKKPVDHRTMLDVRLAGGFGMVAAKQDAEALLRRAVLANLLFEDIAYEDGENTVENIKALIPQVEPRVVYDIAIEARHKQKLRHVPLLIAREMARLPLYKQYVSALIPQICTRADQITDLMGLYWADGKQPLSNQFKKGLAAAFQRFDEYSLKKYNRDDAVKLRDVLFLCHAKPKNLAQADLWKRLIDKKLAIPDTWEVALSSSKNKKETWERLIKEEKLGSLAFVRNLRNFEESDVSHSIIADGFAKINPEWLLPLDFLKAAKAAPRWERELETLMLKCLGSGIKLLGYSVFVVDVSGSMGTNLSNKSEFNRMDAAAAMAMMAAEVCERIAIYVTAGNDSICTHKTEIVKPRHGFALADEIKNSHSHLGGGGIFTRQCLEYIKMHEKETPDRIIVFSDSQDCDRNNRKLPEPFGKKNYIVDVSSHAHGVNYNGLWTAEITGWSEKFLDYIASLETPLKSAIETLQSVSIEQ